MSNIEQIAAVKNLEGDTNTVVAVKTIGVEGFYLHLARSGNLEPEELAFIENSAPDLIGRSLAIRALFNSLVSDDVRLPAITLHLDGFPAYLTDTGRYPDKLDPANLDEVLRILIYERAVATYGSRGQHLVDTAVAEGKRSYINPAYGDREKYEIIRNWTAAPLALANAETFQTGLNPPVLWVQRTSPISDFPAPDGSPVLTTPLGPGLRYDQSGNKLDPEAARRANRAEAVYHIITSAAFGTDVTDRAPGAVAVVANQRADIAMAVWAWANQGMNGVTINARPGDQQLYNMVIEILNSSGTPSDARATPIFITP